MSSYYDLVERVVCEQTTVSDISYIPSGFTSNVKLLRDLIKKEKSWKIKVLNGKDHHVFDFGKFKVKVNSNHVDSFVRGVLGMKSVIVPEFTYNVDKILKEEVDVDLSRSLKRKLLGLYDISPFSLIMERIEELKKFDFFDIRKLENSFLSFDRESVDEAVDWLLSLDFGESEEIVSQLYELNPITSTAFLSKFKNIMGSIVYAREVNVRVKYVSIIDTSYIPSDSLEFVDLGGKDNLPDEITSRGIRIFKREVFSVGKVLPLGLFREIRFLAKELD